MVYQQRNIVAYVLLTIITCGFFAIYWMYVICTDLYNLNGQPSNAGLDIILSIVTCGIYFIYLQYKWGKMIDSARRRYDLIPRDDSLLYVLLAILGLSIVNYCIIQSQLNDDLIPAAESVPIFMKDDDRRN